MTAGPLDGVRIVDLTDEMGAYATKLLADLGADVIRLEPPEGSLIRDLPPFLVDDEGRRHSMFSWWMDTSKRSVAARIEAPEGRRLLRTLSVRPTRSSSQAHRRRSACAA